MGCSNFCFVPLNELRDVFQMGFETVSDNSNHRRIVIEHHHLPLESSGSGLAIERYEVVHVSDDKAVKMVRGWANDFSTFAAMFEAKTVMRHLDAALPRFGFRNNFFDWK